MKILEVIPSLESGGAEHFVVELTNELCHQGHTVELLTFYDVPQDNSLRLQLEKTIRVSSLNKKKGFDLKSFYKIYQFIKIKKFDVVHAHLVAIKYLLFASFVCRNVKFVATIHSDAQFEAGKNIEKWSRKIMFRLHRCLPITISNVSEKSFERFYGIKGEIINNGVAPYSQQNDIRLKNRVNQFVFLHPASCQPVKNQELLLLAFNKLLDDGIDAKLIWIGNNNKYIQLFHKLEQLMNKNIEYKGVVNNVRDYMYSSDAVCLSSKLEGMPMTIIEAFSVGRPVLCTPVGGCNDLIQHSQNGLLSEDLSVQAYYLMLKSFVSLSSEERNALSKNAKKTFSEYTIEKCAKQYLKVFN